MSLLEKHEGWSVDRRTFLGLGAKVIVSAGLGSNLFGCALSLTPESETRLLVPEGFVPRIVARSGYQPSSASSYQWHAAPDGGACFNDDDGGWVYVSNSETTPGGVGALRFAADGSIVDSYSILTGSRQNCSGGDTPWGSWLSCEEVEDGLVWECDPFGQRDPVAFPGMGLCAHESACVDPLTHQVYLTEDRRDGCLYRFTPEAPIFNGSTDLSHGTLALAKNVNGLIVWVPVPDPLSQKYPMRKQVAGCAIFDGGEGIDIAGRFIRFTTKGDNQVWELNLQNNRIRNLLNLSGQINDVDDLTHTPGGEVLVAEDGSMMRVLYFPGNSGAPVELLQFPAHGASEITGLAFNPGGNRLYFSSQRGSTDDGAYGLSFELLGDFRNINPMATQVEWVLSHEDIVL